MQNKALEVDPESVYALYNKGAALSDWGKNEEAIIWNDKALAIDPKNAVALHNKGKRSRILVGMRKQLSGTTRH